MNLEELERYIREQGKVTIAEVQQGFSLSYSVVRKAFKELEEAGKIYLESGVTFKWVANEQSQQDELMLDVDDDEFDDIDDFDLESLLDDDDEDDETEVNTPKDIAEAITNKLNVFGIKVEVAQIVSGASVTRYVFNVLSPKVRTSDIKRYADEIKSCAKSLYGVRIVETRAGTRQVAIEIANKEKQLVTLDSIVNSDEFLKANGQLDFVVGEDLSRKNVIVDLAQLPNLLVVGGTGSERSYVLNSMIVSLAQKYSPDYLRFLMVDPKFVELSRYNGMPHMLTNEAITSTTDVIAAMEFLINEMERRYGLMRQTQASNIVDYNSKAEEKLPYLVFVVDELADIMYSIKREFEVKLLRLTQKCRAAGIHIVLATQHLDIKVITGVIKTSLPSRIALKVPCLFDSMTVINSSGSECLSGNGDMLFCGINSIEPERMQGAFISNYDIRKFVEGVKSKYPCNFDSAATEKIFASRRSSDDKDDTQAIYVDPYCKRALRFWLEKQGGRASIASIQRNLGIGYNRAGRIMDALQKMGFVEELVPNAPFSKPLLVLVSLEDLDKIFPDLPD